MVKISYRIQTVTGTVSCRILARYRLVVMKWLLISMERNNFRLCFLACLFCRMQGLTTIQLTGVYRFGKVKYCQHRYAMEAEDIVTACAMVKACWRKITEQHSRSFSWGNKIWYVEGSVNGARWCGWPVHVILLWIPETFRQPSQRVSGTVIKALVPGWTRSDRWPIVLRWINHTPWN